MTSILMPKPKLPTPVAPPPAPTIDEGRRARVEADRFARKRGRASQVFAGRSQQQGGTTSGYAAASKALLG